MTKPCLALLRHAAKARTALLAVALLTPSCSRDGEDLERRAARLADEMAEAGHRVDVDGLAVSVRPRSWVEDRLFEDQDEEVFELFHGAARVFGGPVPRDLTEYRRQSAEATARFILGLYDGASEVALVGENGVDVTGDDLDLLLAHELAHVRKTQRGTSTIGLADASYDELLVGKCLEEGYADLVSFDVLLHREGRSIEDLHPDDVEPVRIGLAPEELARLCYVVGARHLLDRIHDEGRRALDPPRPTRPRSSELLLRGKRRDLPTTVALPPPAGGRHVETTIGLLGLYELARMGSATTDWAWNVAVGWDGDRLRIEKHGDEQVLLWRTLWDRRQDASEFEAALRSGDDLFRSRREHWAVDVVLASTPELASRAIERLAELPLQYLPVPKDVVSTEKLAHAPPGWIPRHQTHRFSLGERRWVVPAVDLELRLRHGWKVHPWANGGQLRHERGATATVNARLHLGDPTLDGLREMLTTDEVECEEIEVDKQHPALLVHGEGWASLLYLHDSRRVEVRVELGKYAEPDVADQLLRWVVVRRR